MAYYQQLYIIIFTLTSLHVVKFVQLFYSNVITIIIIIIIMLPTVLSGGSAAIIFHFDLTSPALIARLIESARTYMHLSTHVIRLAIQVLLYYAGRYTRANLRSKIIKRHGVRGQYNNIQRTASRRYPRVDGKLAKPHPRFTAASEGEKAPGRRRSRPSAEFNRVRRYCPSSADGQHSKIMLTQTDRAICSTSLRFFIRK